MGEKKDMNRLIRTHDDIDLEPMRQCDQCWECYACTHDEHGGLTGNCVPILGCEPPMCSYDGDCGDGRTCVSGSCKECAEDSDCSSYGVIELVITGNAVLRVKSTQIARAVHRVICANMLIACVREATADSYRFRIVSEQYSNRSMYMVICVLYL